MTPKPASHSLWDLENPVFILRVEEFFCFCFFGGGIQAYLGTSVLTTERSWGLLGKRRVAELSQEEGRPRTMGRIFWGITFHRVTQFCNNESCPQYNTRIRELVCPPLPLFTKSIGDIIAGDIVEWFQILEIERVDQIKSKI